MKNKAKYRIRNWSNYNRSLVNRGSLTFWISQELIDNWIVSETTGERGRPPQYTQAAIVAMAQVKFVFAQAGRQTCGLVASVFRKGVWRKPASLDLSRYLQTSCNRETKTINFRRCSSSVRH